MKAVLIKTKRTRSIIENQDTTTMSYFAIGATGLVGSHFVTKALENPQVTQLFTLTRRDPGVEDGKLTKFIGKETEEWGNMITSSEVPEHSTFFSSFGTTRKIAGSAENFVKIDHGINYKCFKAAKDSGKFDTAVIVSSMGSNKDSSFLYMKTKGQLEQDIIDLKFDRTIILKPGILLGERQVSKGLNNSLAEKVGSWTRGTFIGNLLGHPVYGEEVAQCALKLSLKPAGKPGEVIYVTSEEIIECAR